MVALMCDCLIEAGDDSQRIALSEIHLVELQAKFSASKTTG
jgi:hypothetical protein